MPINYHNLVMRNAGPKIDGHRDARMSKEIGVRVSVMDVRFG
jgi:hypothetical protein